MRKGFIPVQRSLARSDALNEYIQHVGSAVFAIPPGVRDKDDWWGRALFSDRRRTRSRAVFGNYLIGLREGLEASLVVCILIAYLVKTGPPGRAAARLDRHRRRGRRSRLGFGCALEFGSQELTFEAQEALGGSLSIIAVGLVTWMVFWMRRTARHLKAELHGKLDAALQMGTGALVATAFLAVGREGLETALFVWASVRASRRRHPGAR